MRIQHSIKPYLTKIPSFKSWEFNAYLVIILGILVRIFLIDFHSFSFDELLVVDLIKNHSLQQIFHELKLNDTQQPFFYLISYFVSFLGDSVFVARLPSILFSIAAIYQFYLFAKETKGLEVAILSTAQLSLSSLAVSQSFEFRPYSLLLLLSIITIRYFFKIITSKKHELKNYIIYIITSILIIYTHYYGLLLFITEIIGIMFYGLKRDKKFIKISLLILLTGIAVFTPQLQDFWVDFNVRHLYRFPPTLTELFFSFLYFMSGPLTVVVLLLLSLLSSVKKSLFLFLKQNAMLFFILLFPPIIAILKSTLSTPAYATKYLIISLPPLYILTSLVIMEIDQKLRIKKYFLMFGLSAAMMINTFYYKNKILNFPLVAETKAASDYVMSEYQQGTTQILSCNICLKYYLPLQDYNCWVRTISPELMNEHLSKYDKIIFIDYAYKDLKCALKEKLLQSNILKIQKKFENMDVSIFVKNSSVSND